MYVEKHQNIGQNVNIFKFNLLLCKINQFLRFIDFENIFEESYAYELQHIFNSSLNSFFMLSFKEDRHKKSYQLAFESIIACICTYRYIYIAVVFENAYTRSVASSIFSIQSSATIWGQMNGT